MTDLTAAFWPSDWEFVVKRCTNQTAHAASSGTMPLPDFTPCVRFQLANAASIIKAGYIILPPMSTDIKIVRFESSIAF